MDRRRYPRSGARRDRGPGASHALQRPRDVIGNANVVIAGLFSAKRRDHVDLMDELEAEVTKLGGVVAARFVQRRGISGDKKGHSPGGRASMEQPYSGRTLMSTGKIEEMAEACAHVRADAVVFYNELTDRQRKCLTAIFGRAVLTLQDLQQTAGHRP
ncbi:hypothetical protein OG417_52020 [Actinoallomurus sp. NBC_01490]|uniref:HflX-like GTP-binding protein n=1 Tax=Actinoallomurus sp. NBC_01490 TaxID=2903557 RepID=UPI002E33FA42|nr:hypothetical protein [Actinoallomurus sp. NBC_01490]